MKIFQVITLSELGGAQSVVINLANALSESNEVFVVAGGNGAMWNTLSPNVKQLRIKQLKRSISPLDFIVWIKLIYYYFKYKPDIINLHSSKIGLLGRLAFPKRKTFYTVHGFDSIRVAYRKFLPLEKLLAKRAHIIAVSDYDKNNIYAEGISSPVDSIYNGIAEVSKNATGKAAEQMRADNGFKVLCVARLAAPKRFDIFAETAKLLPELSFYWAGNPAPVSGLPANVHCLGLVPDAAQLNRLTDVFMLASNFEGMPISILEALCCGKPVVASQVGSIPDVLKYGNGYSVENTPERFAEKIALLAADKSLYEKMSDAALRSYKAHFTLETMVDQYNKLYLNTYNKK